MTPIFHITMEGRHLAFRYLGTPVSGEPIESVRARLLDGSRPYNGDAMYCGTCGGRIEYPELDLAY